MDYGGEGALKQLVQKQCGGQDSFSSRIKKNLVREAKVKKKALFFLPSSNYCISTSFFPFP